MIMATPRLRFFAPLPGHPPRWKKGRLKIWLGLRTAPDYRCFAPPGPKKQKQLDCTVVVLQEYCCNSIAVQWWKKVCTNKRNSVLTNKFCTNKRKSVLTKGMCTSHKKICNNKKESLYWEENFCTNEKKFVLTKRKTISTIDFSLKKCWFLITFWLILGGTTGMVQMWLREASMALPKETVVVLYLYYTSTVDANKDPRLE